jgi:hypothetical protein
MKTLHLAPGHSAGGSLRQAIHNAGLEDDVLSFPDDLSCGPIDQDEPSARQAWWSQFHDAFDLTAKLGQFWETVNTTDHRLVLWFGRHSASELAFFLAATDRLAERSYDIVDVNGRRLSFRRRDGSSAALAPQCVGITPPDALRSQIGSEQPITDVQRETYRQHWRRLKAENAPFRVVTEAGLRSTSIDHFDSLLLQHASTEWTKVSWIVGHALAHDESYIQVGDLMLLARVVALVEAGKLVADGDPREMRSCRVRLPN